MRDEVYWETYEFRYRKKTTDWYWAVGIVGIAVATIAIIYGDILFAVFIVLAGGMMVYVGDKKPALIEIRLDEKGIYIDNVLYHFHDIHGFWVEDTEYTSPKLILHVNRLIDPIMIVPIETDEIDSSAVRNYLLNYVVEEKRQEPFSHRAMDYLGF